MLDDDWGGGRGRDEPDGEDVDEKDDAVEVGGLDCIGGVERAGLDAGGIRLSGEMVADGSGDSADGI